MKKNNYLFAVASVRALENALLKQSDLEQLINAEDYNRAVSILTEKGYEISSTDYSSALDNELEKTWEYVSKAAPESEALKAFVVKNDFQNLKAILKAEVMSYNAEDYFVKPCVIEPEKLFKAVSERKFDELPSFIGKAAKNALDLITTTGNGQLCDAVADTAALCAISDFLKAENDELLCEYADTFVAVTDIKPAYRAVKTGKNRAFIERSLAPCNKLNLTDMVNAADSGMEDFCEFLSSGFSDYRAELEKSPSAFEKYCDDKLLQIIKKAKMTAFGVSPLAAYFVAKETEIKCLRIILSGKLSFVSGEIIRERMRELYV